MHSIWVIENFQEVPERPIPPTYQPDILDH